VFDEVLKEVLENEYIKFKNYLRIKFNTINEYDAEDIIQQTVLKLISKRNDALSIQNISAYMYTSIKNGAIDHLRKRKYEVLCIDDDIDTVDTKTVETQVLLSELKKVLKDAIENLDEKYRYVFVETEIKGRSYKSLSRECGIKIGTLLSRKSRAVEKLKSILQIYLKGDKNG
jgi:RNA polymerase sigma factor (sigma-70 family)